MIGRNTINLDAQFSNKKNFLLTSNQDLDQTQSLAYLTSFQNKNDIISPQVSSVRFENNIRVLGQSTYGSQNINLRLILILRHCAALCRLKSF